MKMLTRLRVEYASLWLVSLVSLALYENDVVEMGALASPEDGTAQFLLGTLGIALTLGMLPFALKYGARMIARIRENADAAAHDAMKAYARVCRIRVALFYVVVLLNLSVYAATLQSGNALCALIALFAYLFCVPKSDEIKTDA